MTDLNTSTEAPNTTETAIGFIPCYRLPFLSLFHADCMEIMKQYPDKYFDLAIVDPPYGIGYDGAKQTSGSHGGRKAHEFKGWDTNIPTEDYFKELYRVSKNQIIWGANYMVEYLKPSMGWIIWRKDRGNFSSSDAELAYTSFNRALREYTKNPLVLVREGGTFHPTQKPICLYSYILKNYATEGMKILDTHFGSGSIALAVDKANRLDKMNLHLTACEIDKEYIDKAIKRISESIKQSTLSF
jgi:site-specific DNA-methyltransferase (adenine-specific)